MPKWSPHELIILAEDHICYSYTFWTMPILIFSSVADFGYQSLCEWIYEVICKVGCADMYVSKRLKGVREEYQWNMTLPWKVAVKLGTEIFFNPINYYAEGQKT